MPCSRRVGTPAPGSLARLCKVGAAEEVFHGDRTLAHDHAILRGGLRRHHSMKVLVDAQGVGDACEERHQN